MDLSQLADLLKTAVLNHPKFQSFSPGDHWLTVPQDIRNAILKAKSHLESAEIAKIIGQDPSTLEQWTEEHDYIEALRIKIRDHCYLKSGRQPYPNTFKPEVCRLAKVTSVWMTWQALDIPRTTIMRWMKKGWTEIDQADESVLPTNSSVAVESGPSIDDDPTARQLDLFLERHRGKIRKKYSLAEKKLILDMVDRFGSKAVHVRFKVSYDTIARLKRRRDNSLDQKKRIPLRYIPVVDLMKKHPGMGPMQIRDYMRRHFGLSMGVNSIRKVMEQHGWVPPFVKSSRVTQDIQFYEAVRRNYLWHMDFKHHYINKSKAYILFIQDDQSRFIAGHTVTDSENIIDVLTSLDESIRIHGRPETIMTDGGSAFFSWRGSSKFGSFLEDFGIDQMVAQKPNINGKLENLNGQLEKELLITTEFASLDHFSRELAKWVGFYNFSRPHQGLGHDQVPADRFFPGAGKWYGEVKEMVSKQSLVAETMMTLLSQLKKAT
jgi:transposase InsO family protein